MAQAAHVLKYRATRIEAVIYLGVNFLNFGDDLKKIHDNVEE